MSTGLFYVIFSTEPWRWLRRLPYKIAIIFIYKPQTQEYSTLRPKKKRKNNKIFGFSRVLKSWKWTHNNMPKSLKHWRPQDGDMALLLPWLVGKLGRTWMPWTVPIWGTICLQQVSRAAYRSHVLKSFVLRAMLLAYGRVLQVWHEEKELGITRSTTLHAPLHWVAT